MADETTESGHLPVYWDEITAEIIEDCPQVIDAKILMKDAESSYFLRRYSEYKAGIISLKQQVNDLTMSHQMKIDCETLKLIIENNLIVAECLEFNWNDHNATKLWRQLSSRFLALHDSVAAIGLQHIYSGDIVHLWLTTVYNYLYWCWINPEPLIQNNSDCEDRLSIVVSCLRMVMQFFDKSTTHVVIQDGHFMMTKLMTMTLEYDILCYDDGVECIGLQLMEIYFLAFQLLLEYHSCDQDGEFLYKACAEVIEGIVTLKPSLELCFRTYLLRKHVPSISCFKFGFQEINSRVGNSNGNLTIKALQISCSLLYLKMKMYKQSISHLSHSMAQQDVQNLALISCYLLSYNYYIINDFESGLLVMNKVIGWPLENCLKVRCRLMYGLFLSSEGKVAGAQREFLHAQKIKPYLPLALYYSAYSYSKCLQSGDSTSEISVCQSIGNTNQDQERVSFYEMCVVTLKSLVHVLQNVPFRFKINNGNPMRLDLKLFSVIHPEPEVSLFHATYWLGRFLALIGQFNESADKLLYILDPNTQSIHPKHLGLELFSQVPCTDIIIQDTLAVLIQAERWVDAKTLYDNAVTLLKTPFDKLILQFFFAKIQVNNCDFRGAIDTLLASLITVPEISKCPRHSKLELEDENLVTKVVAKIELNIALVYHGQNMLKAAAAHLINAIVKNKRDKDAVYHYLMCLKKNVTSFQNVWLSQYNVFNDTEKQYESLALNFLLRSQLTQKQVDNLLVDFLSTYVSFEGILCIEDESD